LAFDPEVRKQILLGVNVDGADVPSKLAAEIARLGAEVRKVSSDFATGTGGAQEYAKEIKGLVGDISALQKMLGEIETATKAETKAVGDSISYANVWATAIKEGSDKAKEYTASVNAMAAANAYADQAAREQFVTQMRLHDAIEKIIEDEKKLAAAGLPAASSIKAVTAAVDQSTRSSRLWNQAMVQAGYGIGDLMQTSGGLGQRLMSVTNNVQMATAGLGAWGIAAGVAVTAVAALMTNIKDFDEVLVGLGLTTPRIADELTALERKKNELGKTVKFDIDRMALTQAKEELDALNKGLRDFEKLKDLLTSHEEESGKQVKELIRNVPGGAENLRDTLQAAEEKRGFAGSGMLRGIEAGITTMEARVESAKGAVKAAAGQDEGESLRRLNELESQLERLRESGRTELGNIETRARAKVGSTLEDSFKGDQDAQRNLMIMLNQGGMGDLAQQIRGVNPSAVKTKRELAEKKRLDAEAKRAKHEKDMEDKRAEAERQRLNNQGAANAFAQDQQIARERDQEISRHVTRLSTPLGQDVSAGGLSARIAAGFAGGGTDAAVQAQVAGFVKQRAQVGGVPEALMGPVVQAIVERAIGKVRAEAAEHGDSLQEGARAVAAEMAAKAAQQADTAARKPINRAARDKADLARQQQEIVAADIQAHTGFSPEVAQVAAKDAINKMRHGMDRTTASWSAVQDMLEHLVMMNEEAAGSQILFMQKLQHLEARIQGVGQGVRGVNRRAQRMNQQLPNVQGWHN
jgi:hypothetical protein